MGSSKVTNTYNPKKELGRKVPRSIAIQAATWTYDCATELPRTWAVSIIKP